MAATGRLPEDPERDELEFGTGLRVVCEIGKF